MLRGAAVGAAAGVAGLLIAPAAPAGAAPGRWRVLCATDEVRVGSGKFVQVSGGFTVVVTQPRVGLFRCFDARCTHQGCTCNEVRNRRIECPCHGSQFGIRTGKVLRSPATRPLAKQTIRIRNDNVELET